MTASTLQRFSYLYVLPALLSGFLVTAPAAAAPPPVEHFFRSPAIQAASLSPNGRYLASTALLNGTLQLTVVDLQTREAKNIAGYSELDIWRINWINNDRLVFNVIERHGDQNSSSSGLFAVDRDGSRMRVISAVFSEIGRQTSFNEFAAQPVQVEMVDVVHDGGNSIIALATFFNGDVVPYQIDTVTDHRKEIAFQVPGRARGFAFDQRGRLRAVTALSSAEGKTSVIWYRDDEAQPWRKLAETDSLHPDWQARGFDGRGMIVLASQRGRNAVFRYDTAANAVGTLLASSTEVDVGDGLLFDAAGDKLLGIRIDAEPPRTEWFDKSYAAAQAGLDRAYPGMVNVMSPAPDGMPRLVYSYSSTDPGRYLRYDPVQKKVEPLVTRMPWIEPAQMSEQLVFDYKARDGLPIPSYLTLPKGRVVAALPLVVLPHGGPAVRDEWGFSPEVQFLASRGYAVLQPQFRGSAGFGFAHLTKGYRNWGLAMQDDLTDGVNELVRQGVVDPKRVCIMGASYGGYAAAMGLVKDPALYRCGIDLVGVTDLEYLFKIGRWEGDKVVMFNSRRTIGDPDTMREQFVATSPAKQADKIVAPLFMAYGEKDTRVPLAHGQDLRDALKQHGKTYEWMSFPHEEHGFAKPDDRYKVYRAIDAFLAKYNPAG